MSSEVNSNTDLIPTAASLVKKKNGFKRGVKVKQIVDYIVNDIRQLPSIVLENLEILKRVCNLIENCVKKKDKINKLDIVYDVYRILFPHISQVGFDVLKSQVQTLLDSKIIKKVPYSKRVLSFLYRFLSSSFVSNV